MTTLNMGPVLLDITGVRAGDANARTFFLKSDGQPWDLTGQTVTAQARKKATDPDPAALTAVIDVTSPATGEFTLSWPGDAVAALLGSAASWAGVWDLEIQSGTSDPVTVVAGSLKCVADVTRHD